jgi:hypothetical protein
VRDMSIQAVRANRFVTLHQKGLAVTGIFSRTMTIEASIVDLQPLVMCTTDGQSCIALSGDARIKFVLSAVLLDLTSNGWHVSHGADLKRRKLSLLSYVMHR